MSDARSAAGGISGGLFLMTLFTVAWTANTFAGWPSATAWAVFAVGVAAGVTFVVQGLRLLRAAWRAPRGGQEAGDGRGLGDGQGLPDGQRLGDGQGASDGQVAGHRPSGRAFGLVFAAEGVAIYLMILVLKAVGHSEYNVPVIALIVGLHFYPMARIFRRRLDLYIATWTSLVGIAGIIVLATTDADKDQVWAAVAVGAAIATISYGVYLIRLAQQVIANLSD